MIAVRAVHAREKGNSAVAFFLVNAILRLTVGIVSSLLMPLRAVFSGSSLNASVSSLPSLQHATTSIVFWTS